MKGLMIYSNGMEDSEALSTRALLKRAGIDVITATINKDLKVKTAFDQVVLADLDLKHINALEFDFLIIPGGGYITRVIDEDTWIKKTILDFYNQDKLIGAICAAPRFLGRLGLLDGMDYTAFPGSEKEALNGNYLINQKVVVTPRFITARSAGAIIEFVYSLVSKIKSEKDAKALLENIIY